MGPARRVKPDEENLMPPPTTIEELWTRINAKLDAKLDEIRSEIREEGDPWLGNFIRYLRQVYANYRKAD